MITVAQDDSTMPSKILMITMEQDDYAILSELPMITMEQDDSAILSKLPMITTMALRKLPMITMAQDYCTIVFSKLATTQKLTNRCHQLHCNQFRLACSGQSGTFLIDR